jgi:hypothetical protein
MGLIGGIARTAVVAGTFTAVSNRVSRRQSRRWAQQDQSAYPPQQYPPQQYAPQYAAPPPPQYAPPQYAPQQYAPAAPSAGSDLDTLTKMAQLHDQGVLTDEEFAAEKKKILGL